MDEAHRSTAESIRSLIVRSLASSAMFRAALTSVPPLERDPWLDLVFGLQSLPDDSSELPQGCVPYLPCSVDAILRIVDCAGVQASDVFVDVGSGVGRAAVLVHLLTGASTIGLEIQSQLVHASRDLMTRLNVSRFSPVQGDAVELTEFMTIGSIFFLYCPFGGARLEKVLDDLEPIARTRPIRVCSVDLPLPSRRWLTPMVPPSGDIAVYRSTLLDR